MISFNIFDFAPSFLHILPSKPCLKRSFLHPSPQLPVPRTPATSLLCPTVCVTVSCCCCICFICREFSLFFLQDVKKYLILFLSLFFLRLAIPSSVFCVGVLFAVDLQSSPVISQANASALKTAKPFL